MTVTISEPSSWRSTSGTTSRQRSSDSIAQTAPDTANAPKTPVTAVAAQAATHASGSGGPPPCTA